MAEDSKSFEYSKRVYKEALKAAVEISKEQSDIQLEPGNIVSIATTLFIDFKQFIKDQKRGGY
jgi:hypothetical protein